MFVSLPVTPGLAALSREEQVFAMAPAPQWPAPQIDNPQTASVNVSCGSARACQPGSSHAAVDFTSFAVISAV